MTSYQFNNNTGATLKKGSPIFSANGTNIGLALASDNTKLPLLGLLTTDTLNGANGAIQRAFDVALTIAEWDHILETPTTTGLTAGSEYWLSDSVAGKITPTKPINALNQIKVGYAITNLKLDIIFANNNLFGDETNNRVDNLTDRVVNISTNTTGFENLIDSELSFDDLTRTFTIQPTDIEYNIYKNGIKYTIDTAKTLIIPDVTGEYFIYFDDNQDLQYLEIFDLSLILEKIYVAILNYNTTQSRIITDKPCDERHGISLSNDIHLNQHLTVGTKWVSGLGLTGFTVDGDGSLDAHCQFTALAGQILDEDIFHDILAYSQFRIYYRIGSEWRSKLADSFPFIGNAQEGFSGSGRICYNQDLGSGNHQLTEGSDNYHILLHAYALNSKEVGIFLGTSEYEFLTDAREGANNEIITFSGLPFQEYKALGTVIIKASDSFTNTYKAAIVSTDLGLNYVDFRRSQTQTIINAGTDHVHSQYLTEAQANTLYSVLGHSHTNISGNAGTATALQTPRTINGVAFDGTSNITITAVAGNHASTHGNGGSDEIEIDTSQVTSGTFALDKIALLTKGSIITSDGTANLEKTVDPIALQILCSNDATSDGLDYKHLSELYNLSKYQKPLIDEFVGTTTGCNLGWSSQASGTGAGMNFNTALNTQDHPGVIDFFTGTTTTGRTIYSTGFWTFSGGLHNKYFGFLIHINTLSTSGQRYTIWIGPQDNYNIATEFGVGAAFKYSDNINGGNWQLMTCQVTRTTYNPAIPVTVATGWVYVSMLFNDTNTSVQFYINGVAYGDPITTNLPTGNCGFALKIIKSSGTTTRYFSADYVIGTAKLPNGRLGQNL